MFVLLLLDFCLAFGTTVAAAAVGVAVAIAIAVAVAIAIGITDATCVIFVSQRAPHAQSLTNE